jgi:hypothetical protein
MRIACLFACSFPLFGCGSSEAVEGSFVPSIQALSISEFRYRIRSFEDGYLIATTFPDVISPSSSGSAAFNGQLAFDYTGDVRGTAHSDLALNIDFASGQASGRAHGFALASSDGVLTTMSGELVVRGHMQAGQLEADLDGSLAGPASSPYSLLSGKASLDGSFRGLNNRAEFLVGTVAGQFDGSSSLSIVSGAFFLKTEN